jgi:hypothetical protein
VANLLDQQGIGSYPRNAVAGLQQPVFGGGGTSRQLGPAASVQSVPEPILHIAVVPIWQALNDLAVPDRFMSDDSLGVPNQPVYGGDPAPAGLTMVGMFDPRLSSGRQFPLRIQRSPGSTSLPDPLGQLILGY